MTGDDLIVGQNSYYTADLAIRPQDLPKAPLGQGSNSEGNAYPTLVVEVGKSESVPSLHNLSTAYFSSRTTIQIYIAIKMFSKHQDGTTPMLALRYLRTNRNNTVPDVIVSFGTGSLHHETRKFLTDTVGIPLANITGVGFSATACDAPGIPIYQLHIPAAEIFKGSPSGVPLGAINGFNLDLWEIKRVILKYSKS